MDATMGDDGGNHEQKNKEREGAGCGWLPPAGAGFLFGTYFRIPLHLKNDSQFD